MKGEILLLSRQLAVHERLRSDPSTDSLVFELVIVVRVFAIEQPDERWTGA